MPSALAIISALRISSRGVGQASFILYAGKNLVMCRGQSARPFSLHPAEHALLHPCVGVDAGNEEHGYLEMHTHLLENKERTEDRSEPRVVEMAVGIVGE